MAELRDVNREHRPGGLQYCVPVARRDTRRSGDGGVGGHDVVRDGEAQAVHAESQSLLYSRVPVHVIQVRSCGDDIFRYTSY